MAELRGALCAPRNLHQKEKMEGDVLERKKKKAKHTHSHTQTHTSGSRVMELKCSDVVARVFMSPSVRAASDDGGGVCGATEAELFQVKCTPTSRVHR